MSTNPTASPLILTAKFDEVSQARLDGLRERYFPPERNMIPAHLSLFNQLPAGMTGLIPDLEEACALRGRVEGRFDGLKFLGKGVAYTLDAPRLVELRKKLAREWEPWLAPQDRQKLSPHVTIQNKVDPQTARDLHARLTATFEPFETVIEGVSLWRYLGGPWEPVRDLYFSG
ncbi:2'-5' RNA ligase family protein [Rubrobacter aplysinae]|uniref:2'-5' RNA ligase family protein n=1 Tax=Rubrobacter aplysinae TaxID=909625 RepID=UPI00064BF14C|nr:2'-5' RNA ligase family protein [Rubrobacter aplysinae]